MHKAFFSALFLRTLLASLLLPSQLSENRLDGPQTRPCKSESFRLAWLFQPSNSLVTQAIAHLDQCLKSPT